MMTGAVPSAMAVSTYPPRILFIRLSAVGDVINTLPALEALRRGLPTPSSATSWRIAPTT
jgi:ADP-heptose:LPS heptosyltransferase